MLELPFLVPPILAVALVPIKPSYFTVGAVIVAVPLTEKLPAVSSGVKVNVPREAVPEVISPFGPADTAILIVYVEAVGLTVAPLLMAVEPFAKLD